MVEACDLLHAFISAEDGFIGGTRFEAESFDAHRI